MIRLNSGKILMLMTAFGILSACGVSNSNGGPDDVDGPRIALFQVKGSNGTQTPALIDRNSSRTFSMDWTINSDLPAYLYIYVTKDAQNFKNKGVTIYGGGCGGLEPCGRNQQVVCDINDRDYVSCKMDDKTPFPSEDLTPFQSSDGSPSYIVMEACVLYTCVTEMRTVQIK